MRKVLISLAATGAALVFATPAAAQYPAPQQYGGQPYGAQPYGYGYNNNNYGQVRALHARINAVEHQIRRLDRRDRIGERAADRLRAEANNIERRLRFAARNGLSQYEARDLHIRIARLEQRVRYSVAGRWDRAGFGWNQGRFYDRDHDGRNDRYENDRGRDHDD
jgi:hypothetical protein